MFGLRQIGEISYLGEGLEFKVLREVRRNVAEIASHVRFDHTLEDLQLRGGGADVGHTWSVEFLPVA